MHSLVLFICLSASGLCLTSCNSPATHEAEQPAKSATSDAAISLNSAGSKRPDIASTSDTFRVADGRFFTLEPISEGSHSRITSTSLRELPSDSAAAVAAEQRFLHTAAGLAWRSGDTLLFRTKHGSIVKLRDGPTYHDADDSYEGYRYLDNLSAIEQWLVDVAQWEGHYFLLIDQASGQRTNLIGYPVISPDRTRFVCASYNETEYNFNGLQLWQKPLSQPPKLLWQRLNGWGAECPVWASNRLLLFRQVADTTRYVQIQVP